MDPRLVEGVEIYRGFDEVPKELLKGLWIGAIWPGNGQPQPPCGVAIVWTRSAW